MQIHRARFLVLASTLAATGCVVTNADPNRNGDGSGGSSGDGGSTADSGSSSGGSAGADSSAPDGSSAGGSSGSGDGGPGSDGGETDGSTGADGSEGGSTCDDSVGDPVPCTAGNVCAAYDWGIDMCNEASTYMKPRPAAAFAECVQECDDPYACRDTVLKAACLDASAATACSSITSNCSNIDEDDCVQYLSGLTEDGRAQMVTCTDDGGVFCDLYTCSESIGYW